MQQRIAGGAEEIDVGEIQDQLSIAGRVPLDLVAEVGGAGGVDLRNDRIERLSPAEAVIGVLAGGPRVIRQLGNRIERAGARRFDIDRDIAADRIDRIGAVADLRKLRSEQFG